MTVRQSQFDEPWPHGYSGEPPRVLRWHRLRWQLLLLLGRITRQTYTNTSGEDDTCGVTCVCGNELWCHEGAIAWCKTCGRGYRTVFAVRQYPAWSRPSTRVIEWILQGVTQRLHEGLKRAERRVFLEYEMEMKTQLVADLVARKLKQW